MVFEGTSETSGSTCTDCTSTTSASTGDIGLVEAADRVSTIMAPFTDLITVLVNALTAVVLIRKL
jgi:hypothetical protein